MNKDKDFNVKLKQIIKMAEIGVLYDGQKQLFDMVDDLIAIDIFVRNDKSVDFTSEDIRCVLFGELENHVKNNLELIQVLKRTQTGLKKFKKYYMNLLTAGNYQEFVKKVREIL